MDRNAYSLLSLSCIYLSHCLFAEPTKKKTIFFGLQIQTYLYRLTWHRREQSHLEELEGQHGSHGESHRGVRVCVN